MMECSGITLAEETSSCRSTESKVQKRKRSGKIEAKVKRLKAKMGEIGRKQNHIKEEQKAIRQKFEEMENECDQFRKETFLISRQADCNQQRLNLMLEIMKARGDGNLSEANKLTQSLRKSMTQNMKNISGL